MTEYIVLATVIVAVAGYFLGCSNGAILVSKYILKNDIRNHGSGNAGLTNFHRVFGGKLTILVILVDVLKAVFACLIGGTLFGHLLDWPVLGEYIGGVACLLGHVFPCMFQFKGGKGILAGGTVAIMIDWRVALVVWGLFLIAVLLTRMVSLGSVLAGAAFPFATAYFYRNALLIALGAAAGLLVLWRHWGNIVRIAKGEERTLSFTRKKEIETEKDKEDAS